MRGLVVPRGAPSHSAASPLVVRGFFVALAMLVTGQVFIFPPGTNVGPYAYAQGQLAASQEFLGLTPYAWGALALGAVCVVGLARTASGITFPGRGVVWAAVALILVRGVSAALLGDGSLDAAAKAALPLAVCLLLAGWQDEDRKGLPVVFTVVNIFVVAQSLLSKLVTGKFAANLYYLELAEEYFGFFYHPFAFVGSLGLCSLVAVQQLAARRQVLVNGTLLAVNLWLIYQSQIRTYLLAVVLALAATIAVLAVERRRLTMTLVVASAASLVVFLVELPFDLAGDRRIEDLSSGRLERWAADLRFLWVDGDGLLAFFGGGGGYIHDVNLQLVGTRINSLNFFLDIFADYGAIGLVLVVIAWLALLRRCWSVAGLSFASGLAVFWMISSFITNVFEFSSVGVLFAVALACPAFMSGVPPRGSHSSTRPDEADGVVRGSSLVVGLAGRSPHLRPREVPTCRMP